MRVHCALLTLALLVPLSACSKSEAGDGSPTGGAAGATSAHTEGLDPAQLSPDALKSSAATLLDDLRAKLLGVADAPAAKELAAQLQPKLDQLAGLKDELAGSFDTASVQKLIDDVTAKLSSNAEVMAALQPLLDKLKALIA